MTPMPNALNLESQSCRFLIKCFARGARGRSALQASATTLEVPRKNPKPQSLGLVMDWPSNLNAAAKTDRSRSKNSASVCLEFSRTHACHSNDGDDDDVDEEEEDDDDGDERT